MHLLLLEGRFYEQEKEYQKAIKLNDAAIEIAEELGNEIVLFDLWTTQSDLYFVLKNYLEAEKTIKKCLPLNIEDNKKFAVYNIYAKIKLKQSQCVAATNLLEKATIHYNEQIVEFAKAEYFENMARIKACFGEFDSFNNFLDKAFKSQKVLYQDIRANETKVIEAKYNSRLQIDSIKILALQNENYKNAIADKNIDLFITVLMLNLAGFLIVLLRKYYKTQKQLNAVLKKKQEEKQQLFINIAHEFQTPLSIISGLGKKISAKTESVQTNQEYLGLVIKNSTHLSEMTNQILELSKIEHSNVELFNRFFSVFDLIQYLTSKYRILAKQKGINLRVSQYPAEDVLIYSDVKKVETVFNNVLSNAIKYTESGGEIELSYQITRGDFHQIDIRDTGIGISKSELLYIFDRYYQTENVKAEGGFGIGLAISKTYLNLLNGKISVKSQKGKGSVFSIKLPKLPPNKINLNEEIYSFPTENLVETVLISPANLADVTNKIQILVVENTIDFCKYLETILKDDYALTFTHNGMEAMEYLKENIPALIITDWMMPDMDGMKFVQDIKKIKALLRIPILMLTARNMVSDQIKAFRVGIDDYLSKPVEEHFLKERIFYLLNLADQKEDTYQDSLIEQGQKRESNIYSNLMSIQDQKWLNKLETFLLPRLSLFDLNLEQVAGHMELSIQHLNHKVKLITGLTAKRYIQELRYWEARRMLEEKEYDSVKAVCLSVGFKDRGNFSRKFKMKFGKYPKDFL